MVRRDTGEKAIVPVGEAADRTPVLLAHIQADLLARATERREARTVDVSTADEAVEAAATGWARIPWDAVRGDGEKRLARDAVTVRCLQRADGSVPDADDEAGLVAFVGRSY